MSQPELGLMLIETNLALGSRTTSAVNPNVLGDDVTTLWQLQVLLQLQSCQCQVIYKEAQHTVTVLEMYLFSADYDLVSIQASSLDLLSSFLELTILLAAVPGSVYVVYCLVG